MSVDTKLLRELHAAATPGPWVSRNSEVMTETFDGILHGPARPENAALVAALRNEAPALLDELDRLCAEIEALPSYKRDLDIAEASLANTDAELDRLRNEPLRQQADALMRDLAIRTKELEDTTALQERTRQANVEQSDELDRLREEASDICEEITSRDVHHDQHHRREQEMQTELDRLRRLEAADTAWPLLDVLQRLADATEHGLTAHDCDHHGHESDRTAIAAARRIIAECRAAKEGDRG